MHSVIAATGLFATAILLGSMLFFSAVVAPLVFAKLDAAVAGGFIRQMFPWYYLLIIALAALAALAVAFERPADAVALAGVAGAGLYARQMLMPAINRARDASLAGETTAKGRFARLHRLSVLINLLQIVVAAVVLARFVPS